MNSKTVIIFLIFTYILNLSFECKTCRNRNLYLDDTKSWFPIKGKTQLTFIDNLGNSTVFKLHVVDTTATAIDQECGAITNYQYINSSLYLNSNKTDSIYFTLGSSAWLCVRAYSNNNPNITMCDVFGQTKEGIIAKRLSNYHLRNKIYPEVILLIHNQGYSDNIDSVFIANKVGIIGLNYFNKKYVLQ